MTTTPIPVRRTVDAVGQPCVELELPHGPRPLAVRVTTGQARALADAIDLALLGCPTPAPADDEALAGTEPRS